MRRLPLMLFALFGALLAPALPAQPVLLDRLDPQSLQFPPLADDDEGPRFGAAVASAGDWLLLGAPRHRSGETLRPGAAGLFQRVGDGWEERETFVPVNPPSAFAEARCGHSVALAERRDALAPARDQLIGCPFAAIGSLGTGGAVSVVTQTLPEGERSAVMFFSQQAGHEVGASVALAQTVGGTGYAAIGVPGLEQVWILRRDAGSVDWQFETNLSASGGSPGDRFGHSVALATAAGGGHVFLVVGAPQQTFLAGAAYVFFRNPANGLWSQTAQLQAPSAQFGDLFGSAVAFRSGASMAEDRIAVGASNRYSNADTTLEYRRGTVSLFKPGAVGFEHEGEVRFNGLLCAASATLCEGKQQAMGFGAALAFDASGLWIGAPNFEQSDGANVGRVYRAAYGSVLSDSQWWLRSLLSPGPLSSDCEADPNQWGRAGGRFGSALAPIVGGAAVGYPGRGCVLEVPPNTADPRLGEVRLIGLGFAVFGDGFESP